MIGNLSGRQILLIILAIVVVIWLINWIFSSTTIKTQVVRPIEIQNPNPALGSTLNPALGSAQNSALAQATQPVSIPAQSKNIPVNETELPSKAPFTLYYFYSPTCPACQKFSLCGMMLQIN